MQARELLDHPVSLGSKVNLHFTLVCSSLHAIHQAELLASGNQGNGAVMMGLQLLRELPYGRPFPVMVTLDVQQQQILKMGQAVAVHRLFAETQEAPQLVAEIGQCFEFLLAECIVDHGAYYPRFP